MELHEGSPFRRWQMTRLCVRKLRILVWAKPDGIPQDASTTTLLTLNISPTEIAVPAMNSAGIANEGFGIGAAQVSKEYDEALAKVGGSVRTRRRGGVDVGRRGGCRAGGCRAAHSDRPRARRTVRDLGR